jgi:glycosyltransferase involved in cell wall biosynthesis
MQNTPLVSVLIPVYNAGEYLQEAVLSILNQTYTHLEIIIIDDGSTDGCIETIIHLKDDRIKFIQQENQGKSVALNKALDMLQGDFFIIQDADDRSHLQRVERQLECLNNNIELAAVYIGYDLILAGQQFAPTFESIDIKTCKALINNFKNPGHDASGMYRVSLVKEMKLDESLRIGQGIDFVLRVGEKFPIMCLGLCLYSYRINNNSITHQSLEKNNKSVNIVREKACQRRNLDFNDFKITFKKNLKYRYTDIHIVPHCMKSVLNLKSQQQYRNAFYVAWKCFMLHPSSFYYVKPLFYFITPSIIVVFYRKIKQSLLNNILAKC